MSLDQIFVVANGAALLGWLLLIFAPRWQFTRIVVLSGAMSLLLAALYLALFAVHAGGEGGFGSLPEVVKLFRRPEMVLIGWVHYLSFDLFVGAWEVRNARERGVPHLIVVPCLVGTFMLGPIGLLAYFLARALFGGRAARGSST